MTQVVQSSKARASKASAGSSASSKIVGDFDEGTIVRIVGLPNASTLNGCTARVQHFSREIGRYALCVLSGSADAKETLEPSYLVALPLKEEVNAILVELSRSEVTPEIAFRSLLRLRDLPVDAPILKDTQVGRIVNELTKKGGKLWNNEVAVNIGRQLVQKWREEFKAGRQQELASEKGGNLSDHRKETTDKGFAESHSSGGSSSSLHPRIQGSALKKPFEVVANREEGSSEAFFTVDASKCHARIWNNGAGGQCSRLRAGPSKEQDLCSSHQILMDRRGCLPHGRVDGNIPEEKQVEFKQTQVRSSFERLSRDSNVRSEPASERLGLSSSETFQNMRNKRSLDLPVLPPINSEKDARNLVTYMKNAPNDRIRMAALMSLDRTPPKNLPSFLKCGGLLVLEKWIMECASCRFACLSLLMQLPLADEHIALVEQSVKTAMQDAREAVKAKAAVVFEFLRNPAEFRAASPDLPTTGQLLETRLLEATMKRIKSDPPEATQGIKRPMPQSRIQPALKPKATVRPLVVPSQVHDDEQRPTLRSRSPRLRQSPRRSQNMAMASREKDPSLAVPIKEKLSDNGATPSREPSISKDPVAVVPTMASSSATAPVIVEAPAIVIEDSKHPPIELPPELRNVHPKIQEVLFAKPKVIKLLQKHPEVMNNLHAGTISRLGALLKRAQESEQLQENLDGHNARSVSDIEAAACRTVVISSLPKDATTNDVEALFDRFGPVEVELPRESRKKRHVGIAYVKLVDAKAATEAARVINGSDFTAATDPQGTITKIVASLSVSGSVGEYSVERVNWKASDELWQQRMFSPYASVIEGCQQVAVELRPTSDTARAEFRDAARKEREEQAKMAEQLMSQNDLGL